MRLNDYKQIFRKSFQLKKKKSKNLRDNKSWKIKWRHFNKSLNILVLRYKSVRWYTFPKCYEPKTKKKKIEIIGEIKSVQKQNEGFLINLCKYWCFVRSRLGGAPCLNAMVSLGPLYYRKSISHSRSKQFLFKIIPTPK